MSIYTGWAIQLDNGKFANDQVSAVGPQIYPLKREAVRFQEIFGLANISTVVKVTVTVEVA